MLARGSVAPNPKTRPQLPTAFQNSYQPKREPARKGTLERPVGKATNTSTKENSLRGPMTQNILSKRLAGKDRGR